MRPVNDLRGINAVKLRVLWVKDLDVRSPKIKAAQQGGFDLNLKTSYGITPAGRNALYFAGLTDMEAGQNASAEDALTKVSHSWDRNLAALGRAALASLYHQTGRDDKAIDTYNQMIAHPTDTMTEGMAKLQLAALYESMGRNDDAKKIYAALKDSDAKGAAGEIAAQKLNGDQQPAQ